ncbi:MAG TPA: NAD(P)-dependent oxidoreductase [Gaiellaceae bacterium]|nr:NAD(P)-dependent oxidoreductase [Gaiellaceae bacterium]
MRVVVTGARGFLGSRMADLLQERGHEVVRVSRPKGATRALAGDAIQVDAGDPAARDLLAGATAVFHFAGVPDPARSRADPAWAVRQNAGTTLNLLEGCQEHDCGLVFPSTIRAALDPPPDPYALSKRLGEETCRLHPAHATVIRLTSVFGPGQVAREGATGAIAAFAARALADKPIVIPGDPERARDFVYVDDLVPALEAIAVEARWNETLTLASGVGTPLRRAAELVRDAAGSEAPIETPGGALEPGENLSYGADGAGPSLGFGVRPLEEAIPLYVDWLRRHPTAQGRSGS